MKRNILRWFGHIEKMKNEEFMKKMYMSETEGPRRRGMPAIRWKDKVKEYMYERVDRGGGIEQARRERWMLFCHCHPLRERGIRDFR